MSSASLPENSERAAVAHAGGAVVASSRPCPVCSEAITGWRTSACSDKCGAAKSRRTRSAQQPERDRRVRELLEAVVQVLGDPNRPE